MLKEKQKNNTTLIIVIVGAILILGALGLAGCSYYLYQQSKQPGWNKPEVENIDEFGTSASPSTSATKTTDSSTDQSTSDWLTYSNQKYGLLFKYPSDWNIVRNEDDIVALGSSKDGYSFEFRSDLMSAFGLEGCNIKSQKDTTAAGFSAQQYFLDCGTNNLSYVKFEKEGIPHLAYISYQSGDNQAENIFNSIVSSMDNMGE